MISLNNNQREYHSHGNTSSNQQEDSPHSSGSSKENLEIDSPSTSPDLQNAYPADMVNQDHEVVSLYHLNVKSIVQKLEDLLVQQ